jgi:DNA helicase II / ATP-dependent DNA helicase PcrA
MESAARTLQQRIKPQLQAAGFLKTPTISTIHALAFRLLTERDHASRLGMDADGFRMADDQEQTLLLNQAALATHPLATNQEDLSIDHWQNLLRQAINHAKSLELSWGDLAEDGVRLKNDKLKAMAEGMKHYEHLLSQRNTLDYTDLIVYAVQLLETHADIRERYQSQFSVIIEDEAQDSSYLLQRLLTLLGGENPNLIRCGDTNQSITTTFSAAEPEVFRQFIRTADAKVLMQQSGRCAKPIIQLANHWMSEAPKHQSQLEKAFILSDMRAIEGTNPHVLTPLQTNCFPHERNEKAWLIEHVQAMQAAHPQATLAILLRHNKDVLEFTDALMQQGILAYAHTERQPDAVMFRRLEAWLGVLVNPHEPATRLRLLDVLVDTSADDTLNGMAPEDLTEWRDMLASIPLFSASPQDISTLPPFFQQLYYDWHDYTQRFAREDIPTALLHLVERYADSILDRSNGFLAALQAQSILQRYGQGLEQTEAQQLHLFEALQSLSPLEIVWKHLQQLSQSKRGIQLFTEDLLNPVGADLVSTLPREAPIQVMTLHKSKGMEFDLVWMPRLTQAKFPDEAGMIRLGHGEKAMIGIQRLAHERRHPDIPLPPLKQAMLEFQVQNIEEEARLLYVGITRSKRGLFLSSHLKFKNHYFKEKETQPTLAFRIADAFLTRQEASTNA